MKSYFISLYIGAIVAISWLSVRQLLRLGADVLTTQSLPWVGAALTAVPVLLLVSVAMMSTRLARTSANLPLVLGLGLVGWCMALYGQWVAHTTSQVLPGVLPATAGVALLLVYVFWYSRFGGRSSQVLGTGQPLPGFSATRVDGAEFDSASLRGRPALILFFRGNWCPFCVAQIREIADDYQRLSAAGVQVVMVSPQPQRESQRLAAKFDVPITFLVDAGNALAQMLDIAAPGGLPAGMQVLGYDSDTVLPTVVLLDEHGVVIHLDQTDNYRVRPEPAYFLNILRDHGYA